MKYLTKHFKLAMGLITIAFLALAYVFYSLVLGDYSTKEVPAPDTRVITSTHVSSTDGPNSQGIVFVCQDAGTSKALPDCLVSEVGGTGRYCLADVSGVCQIDNLSFGGKLKFVAGLKGYADERWPSRSRGDRVSVLMYPGQLHHFKLRKQ